MFYKIASFRYYDGAIDEKASFYVKEEDISSFVNYLIKCGYSGEFDGISGIYTIKSFDRYNDPIHSTIIIDRIRIFNRKRWHSFVRDSVPSS